jgi:DnaJ like chaperone protein
MNLLLAFNLLYSQSNGYQIYDYFNVILVVGVLTILLVYLPRYKIKQSNFNFTSEFLKLTAYILKSDQKVTKQELEFVYQFFISEFGTDALPFYKKHLSLYIKATGSIKQDLKKVDYNQDPNTKLQLLNFLVKITVIDGFLSKNELKSLQIITKGIGLRPNQLESVLAMYSFIIEEQYSENKQNTESRYKRNLHSKLDQAYKILELSNKATPTEIKKTYRKLVILYHPDKAMHLEKEYQRSAKEMYQKVTDAYDIIKSTLDFK